ncbi:ATP-binding protein [Planobispora longispora]|uniref:ATP-binding protein n=1 Tax=Planobispora longispora TaxID=28887 RepID=UPI00361EEC81
MTTWEFTRARASAVRGAIAEQAARHGLKGVRRSDFLLAVYESMTNAVKHAGGRGLVRLWADDGLLHCEIADRGPGIPVTAIDGDLMPPGHAIGGRGLWLIRRLSESADFTTGPGGTTVRIAFRLDGGPSLT